MHVRPARTKDLDRLVAIHTSAFPDPRGHDARVRNFTHNALGPFDALRVVEDRGAIVGHAFLFPMRAYFGGALVSCGGIASVGVAPEARGTGVAGALLDALHAEADERGFAITILHAFRQGFYARHGYATASAYKRLSFSPHAVPRDFARGEVRAARGSDRSAIEALHARAGETRTGWLARTSASWEQALVDERRVWLVAPRGRGLAGYVAWSLVQTEAHAATTMRVHELVADDEEARRALLAAIGAQRDQVTDVRVDAAMDDPLELFLVDMDRARFGDAEVEHTLGSIAAGPMVRVVDLGRALEARGYPGAESPVELTFEVGDGKPRRFVVGSGRAKRKARVHADARALAAVLYGGVAPDHAVQLGMLRTDDAAAARALALPPYFALDAF